MKKSLTLSPRSALMLNIGLFIVTAAYFASALYICFHINDGIMTPEYAFSMIEHVTMTLVIVVACSLALDIHIKYQNR